MRLQSDIKRALSLPPHVVACKAAQRARRALKDSRERLQAMRACTYARDAIALAEPLSGLLAGVQMPKHASESAQEWLAHRFSLLGSGPVTVAYGMACYGLEGHRYPPGEPVMSDPAGAWLGRVVTPANLAESRRIWSLVSPDYVPIDWQIDFKSGYRWSARTWYRDIRYGHLPGVDVKVPWELARCQHLPALAALAARSEDEAIRERYAREVLDVIVDFVAQNPPAFGVDWACPMDVGIRAANWTLALDLLREGGMPVPPEVERVMARSLLEHGRHIVANLEWSPELRSNHYLADVAGLFFIAAHLERTRETDAWLAFALQELAKAAREQFHQDGGNFEGSTSYHVLSLDMVAWSLGLLSLIPHERLEALRSYDPAVVRTGPGLDPPPVDVASVRDTLSACVMGGARFISALTRPDGLLPQFGDNDSGLFALVGPEFVQSAVTAARLPERPPEVGDPAAARRLRERIERGELKARQYLFSAEGLREGLTLECFPESGFYVWRSERLYLAVRCGAIGQNGAGGHDHCDQLGIELWINGAPLVRDPGTYLYTPLPERRNEYRSAKAHFVPRVPGREPARLDLGLFVLPGAKPGVCECANATVFVGRHEGYGEPVWRMIEVCDDAVVVTDASTLELEDLRDHRPPVYSPGYGLLE